MKRAGENTLGVLSQPIRNRLRVPNSKYSSGSGVPEPFISIPLGSREPGHSTSYVLRLEPIGRHASICFIRCKAKANECKSIPLASCLNQSSTDKLTSLSFFSWVKKAQYRSIEGDVHIPLCHCDKTRREVFFTLHQYQRNFPQHTG